MARIVWVCMYARMKGCLNLIIKFNWHSKKLFSLSALYSHTHTHKHIAKITPLRLRQNWIVKFFSCHHKNKSETAVVCSPKSSSTEETKNEIKFNSIEIYARGTFAIRTFLCSLLLLLIIYLLCALFSWGEIKYKENSAISSAKWMRKFNIASHFEN